MAQMERIQTSESPQTPRGRSSSTFEQILHVEHASKWPPSNSLQSLRREHEMHEDSGHHNKKSVISKVKETAKKLKNSMSKKKLNHDNCSPSACSFASHDNCDSPRCTLTLDDDDDLYEDGEASEDPDYLGAPMYESEKAPESCKENARQHPRAYPVVSENHVLVSSVNRQPEQNPEPKVEDKKSRIIEPKVEDKKSPISSPSKAGTITGAVTQTLAPAYNAVSDATYTIASKIAGLTVSTGPPSQEEPLSTESTHYPGRVIVGNNDSTCSQTYDKGVSVKEYFLHKLEPGEDEKALSQAITEAMSPRSHVAERGVVEKVRGAVNSLLRSDEMSPSSVARVVHPQSPIPLSTNAYPVYEEEETHGRILQTK